MYTTGYSSPIDNILFSYTYELERRQLELFKQDHDMIDIKPDDLS